MDGLPSSFAELQALLLEHIRKNDAYSLRNLLSVTGNHSQTLGAAIGDRQLGWTPLHYACFLGHIESVGVLLQFGANPNKRCGQKQLPDEISFLLIEIEMG